ncbi:ABC transporter permease [Streptomyces bluensis]|uniref:ABC transporter permease n=1 Tax=Streptomyces bluensis TaxID=33897 RepID=UPI0010633F96|nr:ABC transporter permease [Streptomyces bluensis]GGZ45807.1 membrane protein [Streptomyces bluensis]
MSASTPPPRPEALAQQKNRQLIAVIVLVPALVALALWAFTWPAARIAPRNLPLGVAGPASATAPVQRELEQRDGAFEIHRYADEAAARDAIEDRTVYGAVIVTAEGPKLLTASAASPSVAQMLQQAVAEEAAEGTKPTTVDVAPTAAGDPRGSAFAASVLPLALAGVASGAVVTLLGLRGTRAAGALLGAAALVGMAATAITHTWLGVLEGNWWAEAGALSLTALAVGAAVAGLAALMGRAGMGLGGLLMVLLGNPFAGASSAPELLPEPAGAIGQWLPPGASASLLRSVSFFDGAAATGPALTLVWWAALGLGAVLLGSALTRRRRTGEPTSKRTPALAG